MGVGVFGRNHITTIDPMMNIMSSPSFSFIYIYFNFEQYGDSDPFPQRVKPTYKHPRESNTLPLNPRDGADERDNQTQDQHDSGRRFTTTISVLSRAAISSFVAARRDTLNLFYKHLPAEGNTLSLQARDRCSKKYKTLGFRSISKKRMG